MWRALLGMFLVAHGVVTASIWGATIPAAPEGRIKPPNPAHSWIFGDVRTFSMIFGMASVSY